MKIYAHNGAIFFSSPGGHITGAAADEAERLLKELHEAVEKINFKPGKVFWNLKMDLYAVEMHCGSSDETHKLTFVNGEQKIVDNHWFACENLISTHALQQLLFFPREVIDAVIKYYDIKPLR